MASRVTCHGHDIVTNTQLCSQIVVTVRGWAGLVARSGLEEAAVPAGQHSTVQYSTVQYTVRCAHWWRPRVAFTVHNNWSPHQLGPAPGPWAAWEGAGGEDDINTHSVMLLFNSAVTFV